MRERCFSFAFSHRINKDEILSCSKIAKICLGRRYKTTTECNNRKGTVGRRERTVGSEKGERKSIKVWYRRLSYAFLGNGGYYGIDGGKNSEREPYWRRGRESQR